MSRLADGAGAFCRGRSASKRLSLLGYKRDIAFIFPDGYAAPDWSYSDALPEEARGIVQKVYLFCEDIERAERELRLRERPN
jgi:hypothetical protein